MAQELQSITDPLYRSIDHLQSQIDGLKTPFEQSARFDVGDPDRVKKQLTDHDQAIKEMKQSIMKIDADVR